MSATLVQVRDLSGFAWPTPASSTIPMKSSPLTAQSTLFSTLTHTTTDIALATYTAISTTTEMITTTATDTTFITATSTVTVALTPTPSSCKLIPPIWRISIWLLLAIFLVVTAFILTVLFCKQAGRETIFASTKTGLLKALKILKKFYGRLRRYDADSVGRGSSVEHSNSNSSTPPPRLPTPQHNSEDIETIRQSFRLPRSSGIRNSGIPDCTIAVEDLQSDLSEADVASTSELSRPTYYYRPNGVKLHVVNSAINFSRPTTTRRPNTAGPACQTDFGGSGNSRDSKNSKDSQISSELSLMAYRAPAIARFKEFREIRETWHLCGWRPNCSSNHLAFPPSSDFDDNLGWDPSQWPICRTHSSDELSTVDQNVLLESRY
ncbi:hypothetical protein GQ43DRAFT_475958 [Delitschia confertaspora ATCC 74209]|uniref:Uncharacterized protein n=1 Tax=Delitschia confertaspora ATCC 74209 TaxID=1513339 RepID=A0A9P4JCB8_9PLEO|nr:hypothetical protein GQ43DRAFT_475958 [Delitschia confertaspora ATCC 74209]